MMRLFSQCLSSPRATGQRPAVPNLLLAFLSLATLGSAETFDLTTASIADINAAFEAGALSSEKLVELCLARIEAYDAKGPKLNAVIAIHPGALAAARALDDERRTSGPRSPLHGIPVVLKDNYDTFDLPTTAGSFMLQDSIPPDDAFVVKKLRDAGAIVLAKLNMSEFASGATMSSLIGPMLNPHDLERSPAGSSGGTGVAIAAAYAPLGLGTDTGGSVRVPASFCGLYGIRPSHGRLDLSGMMRQAPSSDTAGWFARDGETFARVSAVLLGEPIPDQLPTRLLVATDAFGFADQGVAEALAPMVEKLSSLIGTVADEVMAPPGLSVWARAQRTLQPHEAWLTFKDWIDAENPRFAFAIARNLVAASMIPETDRQWAALMRAEARARLEYLLPPGTILCLPTTPFPAPAKGLPISAQEPLRQRIAVLASHGGLAGVPQVSLPGAVVDGPGDGLPIGLSIVGGHGRDGDLVAVARALGKRT